MTRMRATVKSGPAGFNLSVPSSIRAGLRMTADDELPQAIKRTREISKTYSEQYSSPKKLKRDINASPAEWKKQLQEYYDNYRNDTLKLLDEMIKTHEEYMKRLRTCDSEGEGEADRAQTHVKKLIHDQQRKVHEYRRERWILLAHGDYLRADFVEEFRARDNLEKAYLDGQLSLHQRTRGATKTFKVGRNEAEQAHFRASLIKAYDSEVEKDEYWCPILRCYLKSSDICAAHLVPHNVRPSGAEYIFGPPEDFGQKSHLMDPGNGLMISKKFEEYLDKARIAIVIQKPRKRRFWMKSPREKSSK